MIELFNEAHVLAREIDDLNEMGEHVPLRKTRRLRKLMDILKGYAVLGGGYEE